MMTAPDIEQCIFKLEVALQQIELLEYENTKLITSILRYKLQVYREVLNK